MLSLVYLIGFCWRSASGAKTVVKTGAVAFLTLAVAAVGGSPGLVVALCLCALGDFLLSLDRERAFLAGVGAFAAGHLAFVAVILATPESDVALLAAPWRAVAVAGLVVLGGMAAVVLWRFAGALRLAVVAYVPIILSMGVAALTVPGEFVLHGAAAFMLSDLVLALEMFVLRPARGTLLHRGLSSLIWASYWIALNGLGLSLALRA